MTYHSDSCNDCTLWPFHYIVISAFIQPERGVKGYSPLHILPDFDVVKCVPVDYMHCVLEGVLKKLLHLWIDSTNHGKDW
jgi:hypothetical protein